MNDSPTPHIAHVNQTDFKFIMGLRRIEEDMWWIDSKGQSLQRA